MQTNFDLIVVGGGAAGVSVLHYLDQLEADLDILLIEPDRTHLKEKTWCFWHNSSPPLPFIISKSWDQLLVRFPNQTLDFDLTPYQYSCIRGVDFFSHFWPKISQHPNITILEDSATDISSSTQDGVVRTSSGTFTAPLVLQSAFLPPDSSKPKYTVWQHFLGWEIQTKASTFDPTTPVFMDFDGDLRDELGFVYILPWDKQNALVEYTVFSEKKWSEDQYRNRLEQYLSSNYNLSRDEYLIKREEIGQIPMMDRTFPTWYDPHKKIYNLGAMGGLTKSSTGYTFLNIQQQTKAVAEALIKGINFPESFGSSPRYRAYDLLLLDIISRQPAEALSVFQRLFNANPIDRIFAFLDEQSAVSDDLKIMAKMPYAPFLKAIASNLARFVRGSF